MKTFAEILAEVGRTDKNTAHTYADHYDKWFEPFRHLTVNVLELGVCVFGGGSVLALAEYFQEGRICGIDKSCSRCDSEVFSHPRIRMFQVDAYRGDWVGRFSVGKNFDIIIDDASHDAPDQLTAAALYFPLLKSGGVYVCEDTADHVWKSEHAKVVLQKLQASVEIVDMNSLRPKGSDNCLARIYR